VRLAPLGAALRRQTVEQIVAGQAPRTPQDGSRASYAPMLGREDGRIDWKEPAAAVRNRIHGCNPAPGAFTTRDGTLLKLWQAEIAPGVGAGDTAPGSVVGSPDDDLIVTT